MTFKKAFIFLTIFCLTAKLLNAQAEESLSAQPKDPLMTQWNGVIFQAIVLAGVDFNVATRIFLIAHNAMYNAWAHYDAKAVSDPMLGFSRQPKAQRTLENKRTAISYAAYFTMKALLPDQTALFSQLMQTLGYAITFPTDAKSAAGIGARAAKIMLVTRRNDNANQDGSLNPSGVPYDEPVLLPGYKPYKYINTVDQLNNINFWQPQRNADGTAQVYEGPGWGVVEPFAMIDGAQFRPKKCAKRTCTDYAGFKKQAKQIYDISKNLTPEQRFIALYWDSQVITGTLIWHAIAAEIVKRENYGLDEEIKIFFATSAAVFDADIASRDIKRVCNSVRPITVIRKLIDRTWTTLPEIPTPAHPEYTSGHAVITASAAEIYKGITGSNKYQVSYTDAEADITLSWKTFDDVVEQAGLSRMYAGIHFEDAVEVGKKQGSKVGKTVWEKLQRLFGCN